MSLKFFYTQAFYNELQKIGDYIAKDDPVRAVSWMKEVKKRADNLETFPLGCALARENASCNEELRQSVFGKGLNKYRIIFNVSEEKESVYTVGSRHTAMQSYKID